MIRRRRSWTSLVLMVAAVIGSLAFTSGGRLVGRHGPHPGIPRSPLAHRRHLRLGPRTGLVALLITAHRTFLAVARAKVSTSRIYS